MSREKEVGEAAVGDGADEPDEDEGPGQRVAQGFFQLVRASIACCRCLAG